MMDDDIRRQPDEQKSSVRLDKFDLAFGSLEGRPGVTQTKPTTLRATLPLVGLAQTFIVQTVREKDESDKKAQAQFTVFLEYVDKDGNVRLVIPPAVTDVIARQREALTGKARVKAARAGAATRKALGIQPGFMKNRKKGKK